MLLAPPGERHVQDARLLEWVHGVTPASPGTATCVEESSGKRRRKAPPQSGNKRTRTGADEDGGVDEAPQPSLQRTARLRKNQDLLRSLRSQHGARLRLRAERGPSPQELVKQASLAARLQDLDIIRLEAGIERREPAQWDELRVWDPGDG